MLKKLRKLKIKTLQRGFFVLILTTSVLFGLFNIQPIFADTADADFTGLESYINYQMKRNLVPGLSLVIFNVQEIVYQKGFGVKNAATKEPVDEATVFQAASFSKTLTAYAALILVERGELALDEPLTDYLEEQYFSNSKYADRITLRMILNHTSGLSNDSDGVDRKIYFPPGSHFSYSGGGFYLLQQVIEDVTGLPFAEFIDQEIIQPLAMSSTSFVLLDELEPRMATGHEAGRVVNTPPKTVNAAYSLLSTPTDMAKFNMEISRPTLLKPETVAEMLEPTVPWRKNIYWGLGMGILKSPNEDYFWHWGNNYYYCSIMITGKDSKNGVVIMTNGNTGMKVAQELALKIINDYFLEADQTIDIKTFNFLL